MAHPAKQRISELLSALEKEINALVDENSILRRQLELVGDSAQSVTPVTAAAQPPVIVKRNSIDRPSKTPDFAALTSGIRAATSKLISGIMPPKVEWQVSKRLAPHVDGVWDVATAPWSVSLAASASADRTACVLDYATESVLCRYVGHRGSVNSARFHPTQSIVCTAAGDRSVHIWRLLAPVSAAPSKRISMESDDTWTPLISPAQPLPVPAAPADAGAGAAPQSAAAVGAPTVRSCLLALGGDAAHQGAVSMSVWTPDGGNVLSAAMDGSVRLWNVAGLAGTVERTLDGHTRGVVSVATHASQPNAAVTASLDQTLRLWDLRDPTNTQVVSGSHTEAHSSAIFCGDGNIIASSGEDKVIRLWDVRNLRAQLNTIHVPAAANRMSCSSNGQRIAAPCDDGHIRVYDLTGAYLGSLHSKVPAGHRQMATAAAFVSDDKHILTAGFDGVVLAWEPPVPTVRV